jgi:hypothetical protein
MQRCQRCVMPSIPNLISINGDGICQQCRDYDPFHNKGEEALLKVLESHKDRRNRYDCMVTVSGGRDSAFALLKLVKDYKMRVLAVNYENPFVDEQASANIENMVKKLRVPLLQFHLKGNIHERILKNNIMAWFQKPSPAMVPVICIGCKIIWPRIMKIAQEQNIRCIVNGGNPYEYTAFKKQLLGVSQNAGLVSTYFFNAFRLAKEALHNVSYIKPEYLPFTIAGFLFANQYAIGSRLLGFKLDKIDLFHYIPWEENVVLARIQDELDWRYPEALHSSWRFDCRLSHLKDLMYLISLGVTEKDDFYSKLVREAKMSREEALERVRLENEVPLNIIEGIFRQLGIHQIHVSQWAEKGVR